jgi:hypothetical protein
MPRNSRLPTVEQFRTDYPEFNNTAIYPDSTITRYLNRADRQLDQNVYGSDFVDLVELFTAHYTEMSGRIYSAGKSGVVNTSRNVGVMTSKSIDKVSASYDASGIVDPDAGFWNNTERGREFYWWWSMYGMGGRQL